MIVAGIAVIGMVILFVQLSADQNTQESIPAFLKNGTKPALEESAISKTHYVHPNGAFSFAYPEGASVRMVPGEDDGEVLTIEQERGAGMFTAQVGIQIATTPFDEDSALTPERIKKDIPDMVMGEVQMIRVDGTQAVAFTSTDASFGASAEVWMVYGGRLYQISVPDNSRALLYNLLTTWTWNR